MIETTDRGFHIYGKRERSGEEYLFGKPATVSVVESSLARGPHVHIFEGEDGVQLNLAEAKMVQEALGRFIAEVPDRWEQDV